MENFLENKISAIFAHGRHECFESGYESVFSRDLIEVITNYGADALVVIGDIVRNRQANNDVLGEALKWLGYIDDPDTYQIRRLIIELALGDNSSYVRDAAGLGLASMDDPESLPALKIAYEKELIPELKRDILQVMDQIKQTQVEQNT